MQIAGGIVLFLIGIRMIFPRPEGLMGELPGGEPFIVPLAIPLVAGPSGMAAVMLMGSNEPGRLWDWSLALLLAWAATAAILFSATSLYKLLGARALTAWSGSWHAAGGDFGPDVHGRRRSYLRRPETAQSSIAEAVTRLSYPHLTC